MYIFKTSGSNPWTDLLCSWKLSHLGSQADALGTALMGEQSHEQFLL